MTLDNTALLGQAKSLIKVMVLIWVVALGLWQLLDWMAKPSTMPIKQVRIEADLRYLTREEISQTLLPYVETGYFAVDSKAIVQAVTQLEWVEQVSIRRVWPDTVVVEIIEQIPVAVWNKTALLNTQGDVFKPVVPQSLMQLPNLSGIDRNSKDVLVQSRQINQSIASLDLSVQQLSLSEHGSWQVVLNNGIQVKTGNVLPKKEMSKSLKALASLQGDLVSHVGTIDLRYPNGVAVAWKVGYQLGQPNKTDATLAVNKQQPTKGQII